MNKFKIAISPCPNDTFMFGAIALQMIQSPLAEFDFEYHDIEELNKGLLNESWDVAKMSIAHYPLISQKYQLLKHGLAMGFGVGPLIVSAIKDIDLNRLNTPLLIPGKNTTANLLTRFLFPKIRNKKEMLFSEIPGALLNKEFEAGIIIHEGRFTYASKGLYLAADTGKLWEEKTGLPLPLGGIVIRRSIPNLVKEELDDLLRESVLFAMNDCSSLMPYISCHAAEMDEEVMRQHINLYVNEYSVNPGKEAKRAIEALLTGRIDHAHL